MALSSLLASASSARPADTITVPAIPTTARTVAHFFMVGVTIVRVYCIRSSSIWPNRTTGTMLLLRFFSRQETGSLLEGSRYSGYSDKFGVEFGYRTRSGAEAQSSIRIIRAGRQVALQVAGFGPPGAPFRCQTA